MSWLLIISIVLLIADIIFFTILLIGAKEPKQTSKDESVGQIIINWSDPEKEYFECQLYSQEFFKEVHQKESVTFDVVIR